MTRVFFSSSLATSTSGSLIVGQRDQCTFKADDVSGRSVTEYIHVLRIHPQVKSSTLSDLLVRRNKLNRTIVQLYINDFVRKRDYMHVTSRWSIDNSLSRKHDCAADTFQSNAILIYALWCQERVKPEIQLKLAGSMDMNDWHYPCSLDRTTTSFVLQELSSCEIE